jgi:hypothetical protein
MTKINVEEDESENILQNENIQNLNKEIQNEIQNQNQLNSLMKRDDTPNSKLATPNNDQKKIKARKRLTLVESLDVDNLDVQLDNYLVNFYQKKRISQIPFRRLSAGEYEFGTQKVLLKAEAQSIRGINF